MASPSEEDQCCPGCHDIYTDPVVLSCSHSFCKSCLENWWTTKKERECPLCKRRISKDLRKTPFLQPSDQGALEIVCRLHSEELKLFCVEHQQPVCLVCRDSEKHIGHKFRPINEAAPVFKKQLDKSLQPLKDKLQVLNERKEQFSAAEVHVEAQARLTERQIHQQFRNFHHFLEEEEQARLKAVREEEEQKRKSLTDKVTAVSKEIEALSEIIAATEEQLRDTKISFLLQYKAAAERVEHYPLQEEPQLGPGALIDQAKHLGNLAFNIWTNLDELVQFYPVILDPNTSHPELFLSEDLTSVTFGEGQSLPGNPERFDFYRWVLGSEGVMSGSHSWEVEVSGDGWTVGVIDESVQRKGPVNTGVWKIFLYHGKYFAYSPPEMIKPLSVKKRLRSVRVKLDFDRGTLSFYNTNTNTYLHTFTHTFTQSLFPYFETFSNVPLKILPIQFNSLVFA